MTKERPDLPCIDEELTRLADQEFWAARIEAMKRRLTDTRGRMVWRCFPKQPSKEAE